MKDFIKVAVIILLAFSALGQETNYYLKGIDYYKKADYKNAMAQFDIAIQKNYTQIYDVYTYRGLCNYALQKYDAAYNDYQLAVAALNKLGYTKIENMPANIVSSYGTVLYDRGLAQYYRTHYNDAITDMNYALLYKYNAGLCYTQIANSYYALADYSKARDNYTLAIGYNPADKSLYYWRGGANIWLEKWQESINDYDIYLQNYPNDAYGFHYRAYSKIMFGKVSEAIPDVRKSIELKIKDLYLAYRNLGLIYLKLNDCNASIESFKKAVSLNPNDTYSKQNIDYVSSTCNKTTPNVDKPVVKITAPTVSWLFPKEDNTETSDNTFTVKTCVNSNEKPEMSLYVSGIDVSSRDFTIVPTKQPDCPYRYEKQVTFPANANSVSIKFVAKNSGGTSETIRIVNKTQSSVPTASERRIALLVGNGNYKLKPLTNTLNDVDDMALKLEKLGFKVVKYKDLGIDQMNMAFSKFGRESMDYDVALFFYAGHGLQNGSGVNYLVPTDAEPIQADQDFNKYCIEVNEVFRNMKKTNAKVNIIILDACRDNPLDSRSFTRGGGTRGLSAPTSERPRGSFVFYAAQANEVALEGKGERNGIFTGELLKVIDRPNLKLEEVVKETSKAVKQKTGGNQQPSWYSEFDGDFYFKH